MARFCWRERSERVNWRLLRGLQLADVVRRGDPTLLEPYALHLTFARLPVAVQSLGSGGRHDEGDAMADSGDGAWPSDAPGGARNAWFVVRVLQLSMEYLLFLRARDGAVVDSLREELLVCERECELLVERAGKWKERSRSGERQVEKLHQVLQNVAKLLQIEGATPSAVSTIESLLRDLVPRNGKRDKAEPSASHVEEARVCALCGKMFSSQEYLDKHVVRRHPGADMTAVRDVSGKKSASRGAKMPVRDAASNQGEVQVDHANDMKAMLRAVENTLHEHQSKLRAVAQEEADKLHSLYEQLHVETQLAEEMRAKRAAVERDVEKRQRELETIEQEKEDLTEELRVMREQLEFLAMKRKIEAQNGVTSLPTPQPDPTLHLEIKRLEETISMLREALSTAREELQRSHETHGALLKEKVTLESQLLESKNHALRLEASLRAAQDHVPRMHVDKDVQAVTLTASSTTQTDEIQVETPEAVVVAPPARVAAGEVAVQTEELDRAERIDMMMQTDPESIPPPTDLSRTRSPTKSIGISVGTDLAGEDDLDSVFKLKCASILEQVQRRADRAANKTTTAMDQQSDEKIFSSLSRRRYLRSRFLHGEHAVGEKITSHVGKLEQTSLRYGVSPKSSVLANEHVELVQRALQAHLEVLPAEVLQRMIDIDNSVNTLIQKHWMPQEKSRQQALKRLTAGLEAKSQANQGLVRQAMLAFASTTTEDATVTTEKVPSVASSDQARPTTIETGTAPVVATALASEVSPSLRSAHDATPYRSTQSTDKKEEGHVGHDFTTTPQLSDAEKTETEVASIPKQRERETLPGERLEGKPDVPTLAVSEASSTQQQGEPSPVSVQEVRRQAITVRAVKVVSVSPKSYPPRSPPRAPQLSYEQQVEESKRSTTPEGIAVEQESSPAKPAEPRGEATPVQDIGFATTSTDTTAPPVQAVQASGTSVMHSGAPSSFSAKHPESQLGIVIPSRYDPNTITVHGLQNDPDEDSGGRFRDREPIHEMRWSSSAGRSVGASERSFSAVESSEMSFDASIPSLGSEGVSMSRSFPRSSVEQLPSVATRDDQPNIPDDASDADGVTEIPGIESIQEEASDEDEDVVQALASKPIVSQSSEPQRSPRLSPRPNEVMAFDDDDDSDIEEVVLA